ncbi:hypothetical protein E1281_33915 [Actinomadura sp. KC345]|nr:hypothetical protein E1281_33915 [Actinomadura sp. KC345]
MLFLASGLSAVAIVVALAKGSTTPDLSSVTPQGRDLAHTAAVTFLAGEEQTVPHAESFDPRDAAGENIDGRGIPLDYRSLNWVGFSPQHFGTEDLGFTDFEVHHFLVVMRGPDEQTSPAPTSSPPAAAGTTTSPSPGATPPPGTTPSPGASPSISTSPGLAAGSGTGSPVPASNVLQLDVPVLLSEDGPRLGGSPSFSTWKNGAGEPEGKGDYTNYGGLTTEVSDAAKNQILRWAVAYATGDSQGLLAVTGDQNSSHRYMGLSGFTLANSAGAVQVLSAIKSTEEQSIVRVRIQLARAAPPGTVTENNEKQFTNFADFDLLVGAAGAQPPVLAWGPAGSAAELEPYSNALNN